MMHRNWILTTLVVGLLGCGASEEGTSEIPGGALPPSNGGSGNSSGGGGSTTGSLPPPTTGGGNTGGTTSGTTSNGGTDPDGGVCAEQMVSSQRIAPKMLIVLDKSGSMGPTQNPQMIDRWGGSVEALKAITVDLQDSIKFGLMTYPDSSGGGSTSTCNAGKLDVEIGPMNAAAISTALDSMMPRGGTPTAGTLEVAATLFDQPVTVDDVNAPEYVLLVTDGSPNCYMGGAGNQADPAAIQASVDTIARMATKDTKTYVIGYQTAQDAALSSALDQMAAAGGTGDTKHRPVEDKDMLVKAFRDIAAKAVSCTFLLDKAAPDPTYVEVKVDGKQVNYNQPDGWVITPDNKQITLQGKACSDLQGDGQHTVAVKVKCEVVVPM